MAHTNHMPNITQTKLEQFVGHDTARIAEAKQTMIGEDGPHAHRPGMQNALVAEVAERGMAMDDLDLLADEDLSENGEG